MFFFSMYLVMLSPVIYLVIFYAYNFNLLNNLPTIVSCMISHPVDTIICGICCIGYVHKLNSIA